ncbi:MAG: hypothetical protein COB08_000630 [Rhodobacteraceae bacterium]|nr:hypothetical protein [Paracoccaceae bacterium]
MALTQEFTTQAGALCVGLAALASPVAASIAPVALPLIALAAIGLHLKDGCAQKACDKAQKAIIKALKGQPEFPPQTLTRALSLLKDAASPLSLSTEILLTAAKSGNFEAEVVQHLLVPLTLDTGESATRRILETALLAGLTACRQDESFHQMLTQGLLIGAARVNNVQLELLAEIKSDTAEIKTQLDQQTELLKQIVASNIPKGLTLEQLRALTAQFKITVNTGDSPATILQNLTLRAQEIEALEQKLARMRSRFPQLGNAITEASAKLEQGDTRAVRKMVRDARVVLRDAKLLEALEQDAQLVEIDAHALLIEGNLQEAFTILSTAADSFGSLDPLAPSRYRHKKANILYNHGRQYGGAAMAFAVNMLEDALLPITYENSAFLWGSININLAAALSFKSSDFTGKAALSILCAAEAACRNALMVYTEGRHQKDWAIIQSELSMIYNCQAQNSSGKTKRKLLKKSKLASGKAKTIFEKGSKSEYWATVTRINFAGTLLQQAGFHQGEKQLAILNEAIDTNIDALDLISKDRDPENWAAAQYNLATSLTAIAVLSSTKIFDTRIKQSLNASTKLATQYSAHQGSIQWAMSQLSLGNAELMRLHFSGEKIHPMQLKIISSTFKNALRSLSKKRQPALWAAAQLGQANILTLQACNNSDNEQLLIEADMLVVEVISKFGKTKAQEVLSFALFLQAIINEVRAENTGESDGETRVSSATSSILKIKKVIGKNGNQIIWAMSKIFLAQVESSCASLPAIQKPHLHLKSALNHVDEALTLLGAESYASNFIYATELREEILRALSAHD